MLVPIEIGKAPGDAIQGSALEKMRWVVDTHTILSHPFMMAFKGGQLNKRQVTFWAVQQFFFSISLPSAFAALYARIPDRLWKDKRDLVELLKVEAWGSRDAGCHSRHFIKLLDFLGVRLDHLTERDATPYTQSYIAARLEMCLNPDRHLGQGLAAIGLGNEILNLHIFEVYREGIDKIPGLENCPTGYFDAHLRDEENDSRIFHKLFSELVTTEEEYQLAQQGLLELLDKRNDFFNGLWEDLVRVRGI